MRRDGSIYIVRVNDEAAEKGVKANDTLLEINGKPLAPLHFSQVFNMLITEKRQMPVRSNP